MPVIVTCPHCRTHRTVPDAAPGQRFLCTDCRLAFTPRRWIPPPEAPKPPPPEPSEAPPRP